MEYIIEHDPDRHLFFTEVENRSAFVEYELRENDVLDITHTIVAKPIQGRGIAAALVKAAYDYALEHALKPHATCSYAVVWLERHAEYKR